MTKAPAQGLRELWRAADKAASRPLAFYIRTTLVTSSISGLAMAALPVAFLAALFLHNRLLGAIGIILLAVEMANLAVWRGLVVWLVFQQGSLTGWKGKPIRRQERPSQFYGWTAAHAILPAIWAATALFLIVVAIQKLAPTS